MEMTMAGAGKGVVTRIGDAGWLADCVQRPNALFAVHGQ